MTPRPDWQQLGEHIDVQTIEGRSSRDLLEVVCQVMRDMRELLNAIGAETSGDTASSKLKFFIGRGHAPSVPRYLRWTGKIGNMNLSKKQVELLTIEIWKAKAASDAQKANQDTLSDFLYSFLLSRHKTQVCTAAECIIN